MRRLAADELMPVDFATAGGATAAGGFAFQDGVAARLAGFILAKARLPWLNASSVLPESLRCETEAPVDDILASKREKFVANRA